MNAVRTAAGRVARPSLPHHRALHAALRGSLARRLRLDQQIGFWLGELDPTWSLTELRARVLAVRDETHDVKTFVLAPNRAWPGHRAGQYATVEVEIDGVRERRCYSIASAPGRGPLEMTVKRVPRGRMSTFLHAHLRVGDVVTLGAPEGTFGTTDAPPGPLLLLSGGSGITPVMSVLRGLAARGAVSDVVFVHCARSPADVIYHAELGALADRHRGLRVVLRLDDQVGGVPLDEPSLRSMVPDLACRTTLLCGPAGMLDAVAPVWSRAGIADRLRVERFGAASDRAGALAPGCEARVRLTRAQRTVVARGPGTLLDQLERAGERPAHGCRMGICGTCRCRKTAGSTEDVRTGIVSTGTDEDIRLCVTRARSDIALAL